MIKRNKKGQFIKGMKHPWTKKQRKNHKLAFQKYKENNHWFWKGDKVGYNCLHKWISRNFGKADICEKCGSNKKVEWANISKKYRRERKDWIKLCKKCHWRFDGYQDPKRKLSKKQVNFIKEYPKKYGSIKYLANLFKVDRHTIGRIIALKTHNFWNDVIDIQI